MDDNCVHPVTRLFSVRHIWKLLVKKVRAGEDRSDTHMNPGACTWELS